MTASDGRPSDPVLFIGGVPRSGTTLLRNMVAAHPLLAVPDESYFIRNVHKELVRRGRPDDLELAWRLIREERFFKQWGIGSDPVEAVLAAHPPASYPDLIRALFAAHAAARGRPLSADKTPSSAYCFDWYAPRFPGSRFAHIVRDPREVCMSLAVQPWQRGGIAQAAQDWVTIVRRARRNASALGDRYVEIRYEELVAEPAAVLRRLCTFAQIPFMDEMLTYPSSDVLLPDRHHVRSRDEPRSALRSWSDELSRDDVDLIELFAGDLMDQLGYRRAGRTPPSVTARIGHRRFLLARDTREAREDWIRTKAPAVGVRLRAIHPRP